MNFLEKMCCKFMIWRLHSLTDDICNNTEAWKDGEALEEHGCFQCQAAITIRFLGKYLEVL